jgi:hypothetical protein
VSRESVWRLKADFFDGVKIVKVGGLEEAVTHKARDLGNRD